MAGYTEGRQTGSHNPEGRRVVATEMSNRLSHDKEYEFRGPDEPLVKFAEQFSSVHDVDYFVFGHYHVSVDMPLASGSRLLVLKDWIHSSPYFCFDGQTIAQSVNA